MLLLIGRSAIASIVFLLILGRNIKPTSAKFLLVKIQDASTLSADNQDDNNLMTNEKDLNQRDLIHRRRVKNRFRSGRSKKDKNSKANLATPDQDIAEKPNGSFLRARTGHVKGFRQGTIADAEDLPFTLKITQ